MDFSQMKLLAATRTTPAPSGGNQVVSEVKDAVGVAKDLASTFREQLPVLLFHLAMAVVVILAGFLIVRLGKMIISRLIRRKGKKKGRDGPFLFHLSLAALRRIRADTSA